MTTGYVFQRQTKRREYKKNKNKEEREGYVELEDCMESFRRRLVPIREAEEASRTLTRC